MPGRGLESSAVSGALFGGWSPDLEFVEEGWVAFTSKDVSRNPRRWPSTADLNAIRPLLEGSPFSLLREEIHLSADHDMKSVNDTQ